MDELQLTLDLIRAELGEKTSHQIADYCGGQRVRIPDRPDETGGLTNALGANAARILCERFGGKVIDVPTGN
jgi:hypothetical protein